MKLKILVPPLLLVANLCSAQIKWFTLYTDSAAEIRDANTITAKFIADVQKISATIRICGGGSRDGKRNWSSAINMQRKCMPQLPDPVPAGQTVEEYFGKNYEEAAKDPFIYG